MMALVDHIKQSTQLRWRRIHKIKPRVPLNIDIGPYIVKTADTYEEVVESFRLRHDVFHREFRGLSGHGLDFDKFDAHFDHLIIVEKSSKKIIGTYRLNCLGRPRESYTALEFDLALLPMQEGPLLELGRACIHKDYRKGSVISLLWKGILEYMRQSGANLLFGCSSIKVSTVRDAALVYRYLLAEGAVYPHFFCRPTMKFRMKDFDNWYSYFHKGLSEAQSEEARDLVPSLLRSYLKFGAKVACEPAFDEEFNCIDLLTILKRDDLSHSLIGRYKVAL